MPLSSHGSSLIAVALNRLEFLKPDNYIVATGLGGEQFIGTPNGYNVTHLPFSIVCALAAGHIKKITWASYGCKTNSWFFAYELADGKPKFECGSDLPLTLSSFIRCLRGSDILLAALRVQLGADDSFVVWSKSAWACAKVPHQLQAKLREGSSASREGVDITKGSLRNGTLDNVQWHANGSYYIKSGDIHLCNFESKLISSKWNELWEGLVRSERNRKIREELAYVAIGPYARQGETFTFIKKQVQDKEPLFIMSFEGEPVQCNLAASTVQDTPDQVIDREDPHSAEQIKEACPLPEEISPPDQRIQHVPPKPEEAVPFLWATSMKSGQPHPSDWLELKLKKGEKVKVIEDKGRDWFLAIGAQGKKGYVHRSWLKFDNRVKVHRDCKALYTQFRQDLDKLQASPGSLVMFPVMAGYVDVCTLPGCQVLKEDESRLGICIHDLSALLMASGECTYEWLKEWRNVWHPDRFGRYCHVEHAEGMKAMAEEMFVMHSKLMDIYKA